MYVQRMGRERRLKGRFHCDFKTSKVIVTAKTEAYIRNQVGIAIKCGVVLGECARTGRSCVGAGGALQTPTRELLLPRHHSPSHYQYLIQEEQLGGARTRGAAGCRDSN